MALRTVILPVGNNVRAFNWFIGNEHGFAQMEAGNEFGVDEGVISQAALDQKAIDYAADIATVHQDYADHLADVARDESKDEFDDDSIVTALIKEMVDQLNDIRANAGMPLLNFGTVNANIRNRIGQP